MTYFFTIVALAVIAIIIIITAGYKENFMPKLGMYKKEDKMGAWFLVVFLSLIVLGVVGTFGDHKTKAFKVDGDNPGEVYTVVYEQYSDTPWNRFTGKVGKVFDESLTITEDFTLGYNENIDISEEDTDKY